MSTEHRRILAGLADGSLRSLPPGGRTAVAALLAREKELSAALYAAAQDRCATCEYGVARLAAVACGADSVRREDCPAWKARLLSEDRT